MEGVTSRLRQEAAQVQQTLNSLAENVGQTLAGQADAISTALAERMQEITDTLDDKNGVFLSALREAAAARWPRFRKPMRP